MTRVSRFVTVFAILCALFVVKGYAEDASKPLPESWKLCAMYPVIWGSIYTPEIVQGQEFCVLNDQQPTLPLAQEDCDVLSENYQKMKDNPKFSVFPLKQNLEKLCGQVAQ